MKKICVMMAVLSVSACAGVTTGQRSECFDGNSTSNVVSRSATDLSLSFMAVAPAETSAKSVGSHDCDFQNF